MGLKESVEQWLIRRWLNGQVKEGTVIGKVWTWFDGKKTVIGGAVTLISYLASGVPLISPLCGSNASCVTHVVTFGGIALMISGLAHKAYKFIYKTDVQ